MAWWACVAWLAASAEALPAYRRLFEKAQGYAISCTMCHTKGGGSALTTYGVDFLKAGMNRQAFTALSSKDSDGDGATNRVEIEKKSNPGDPASTPDQPGVWLDRIDALAVPADHLKMLFSGVTKFSSVEGALFPDQVTTMESRLGAALTEADKLPTFYFAVTGEGANAVRTGVALIVQGKSPKGPMTVGTAVDLAGKILAVRVFAHQEASALHGEAWARQFEGKTLNDPLSVGHDLHAPDGLADAAAKVAHTVKKSLLTVQQVFAKKKPR